MADFALGGVTKITQHGIIEADIKGTAITASATINTKGSYVELVSAVNNLTDSVAIDIGFDGESEVTMRSMLFDIAIGEAGSEVVVINNMYLSAQSVVNYSTISIPLSIRSGVRISARMQSTVASSVGLIYIRLSAGDFKSNVGNGLVKSYGVTEATSRGTMVVGETTYGAWTELTASTTKDIKGFFVCVSNVGGAWSGSSAFYDVGIGGAGGEIVVIDKVMTSQNSNECGTGLFSPYMGISIPAGTRIAIRALTNSNIDFDMDYVFYGVS